MPPNTNRVFAAIAYVVVGILAALAEMTLFSSTATAQPLPWQRSIRNPAAYVTPGQEFGAQVVRSGVLRTHPGVDIGGVSCGEPVYPVMPGTVHRVVPDGGPDSIGHAIIVRDLDGWYSLYAHLQASPSLTVGSTVTSSTVLGHVGDTGFSDGCHLHLERRKFASTFNEAGAPCSPGVIYQRNDVRGERCFREQWEDPNLPLLGEFASTAPRPGAFRESSPEGFDLGTSATPSTSWTWQFRDAHRRNSFNPSTGNRWLGHACSNYGGGKRVHLWAPHGVSLIDRGVLIQDLCVAPPDCELTTPAGCANLLHDLGYHHGHTALIANPRLKRVFALRQGFWNVYMNHGGPWNLGPPTSDESTVTNWRIGDRTYPSGSLQTFERGALFWAEGAAANHPTVEGVVVLVNGQASVIRQDYSLVFATAYAASVGTTASLLLGGNPYCRPPCTDTALVAGFDYELGSTVALAGVAHRGPDGRQPAEAAAQTLTPIMSLSDDGTTFRFRIIADATTIELTPQLIQTERLGNDIDDDGVTDNVVVAPSGFTLRYRYFNPAFPVVRLNETIHPALTVTSITSQGALFGTAPSPNGTLVNSAPSQGPVELAIDVALSGPLACGRLEANLGLSAIAEAGTGAGLALGQGVPQCVAVLPSPPSSWDGGGDFDRDGLPDHLEACGSIQSNPCNTDSNGNGIPDAAEYREAMDTILRNGFE